MADEWEDAPESTWGSYLAEGAQDFARAGVNAATFGMSDRAAAALAAKAGGRSYDEELAKTVGETEAARERSPYASVGGDVAGSVALPGFGAAKLAGATTRALGSALPRAAPIVGRTVGYGVTGAGVGAAQGAGNTYTGNLPDYIQNATIGGVLGGTLGAAGGAAFGRSRPAVSRAEVPTAAEQELAKRAAYRSLDAHPAQYMPASFAQRADDVEMALRARNAHPGTSPQTFRTVEQMSNPPTALPATNRLSLAEIDTVRKGVSGDELLGLNPTDRLNAKRVRDAIDDFVRNPPSGAAAPGMEHLATDAARVANRARELNAGWRRTQGIDELIANARRQAGSADSGLNLQNILRQHVKAGLKEEKGTSRFSKAGYNPAEREALENFTVGTWTNNRLRQLDRILGGGGGLGAGITAGSAGVGGMAGQYFKENPAAGIAGGLGAAGLGYGLRALGNRRATADINRLRDMIAQRNPLYRERVATAGMTRPGRGGPAAAKSARDAAALAILNQTLEPRRLYMDMEKNKSRWE